MTPTAISNIIHQYQFRIFHQRRFGEVEWLQKWIRGGVEKITMSGLLQEIRCEEDSMDIKGLKA